MDSPESAYKTVYLTVDPDEWEKQKNPIRQYVSKALSTDTSGLGGGSFREGGIEKDVGEARLKRAVRKSLSCDMIDLLNEGGVPWQNVVGKEQTDALLSKRKASKKAASSGSLGAHTKLSSKKADKKAKKKEDPSKQAKIAFYKILNAHKPERGHDKDKFDAHEVCKMMDKLPVLAKEKYLFSAFHEPITALHMLCAIDAPLQCIRKCYKHNPDAVHDTSSTIGSPLHYACWFNAGVESVRYIASKDTPALLLRNRAKRTALHLACFRQTDPDLVILLTAAAPEAAGMQDNHGKTPLHLACAAKRPDLETVEDLTEVWPHAVCLHDEETGATPLHVALANKKCDVDIIKDLVASNSKALKAVDQDGRIPLHVAVENKASIKIIKVLTKKHAKTLAVQNHSGETAHKIAKSMGQGKEILKLLKP